MKSQMTRKQRITCLASAPRSIVTLFFLWALALGSAALPASAQSVAASALKAGPVSGQLPAGAQSQGTQSCDPSALFCNFPEDGFTDAWTINYGYSVTNEIQLPKAQAGQSKAHITGFKFTVWTIPDYYNTMESVSWGLGSAEFGTDFGRGAGCAACGTILSQGGSILNEYGYAVWTVTVTGLNTDIPLSQSQPTNVWFTLHDANLYNAYKTNSAVYWDQNCGSLGCNGVIGTDQNSGLQPPGGESFELLGAIQ